MAIERAGGRSCSRWLPARALMQFPARALSFFEKSCFACMDESCTGTLGSLHIAALMKQLPSFSQPFSRIPNTFALMPAETGPLWWTKLRGGAGREGGGEGEREEGARHGIGRASCRRANKQPRPHIWRETGRTLWQNARKFRGLTICHADAITASRQSILAQPAINTMIVFECTPRGH